MVRTAKGKNVKKGDDKLGQPKKLIIKRSKMKTLLQAQYKYWGIKTLQSLALVY